MTMLADFLLSPFADFAFMRRALAACLALALGCGPIGVFLVLRRMSLMGDALSHAVLPGAAIGFLLGGLSLPAMSVGGFVAGLVALSMLVAFLSGYGGLVLSYAFNLPSGPAIVLSAGALYLLSLLFGWVGGLLSRLFPEPHLEA